MWDRLKEDIRTIKERDPAAKNNVEILLCLPFGSTALLISSINGDGIRLPASYLILTGGSQALRFIPGQRLGDGSSSTMEWVW
jgi:hypothetical protein